MSEARSTGAAEHGPGADSRLRAFQPVYRGKRTVQALVSQNTIYNKTICAYQNVRFSQGVTIRGDVGSEGSANPDLTLQGPPSNDAKIEPAPGNVQPGSAYSTSTVSCS